MLEPAEQLSYVSHLLFDVLENKTISDLTDIPNEIGSMAEFPEEAAAPTPACLPIQPHEADILTAEVGRPQSVNYAAERQSAQRVNIREQSGQRGEKIAQLL